LGLTCSRYWTMHTPVSPSHSDIERASGKRFDLHDSVYPRVTRIWSLELLVCWIHLFFPINCQSTHVNNSHSLERSQWTCVAHPTGNAPSRVSYPWYTLTKRLRRLDNVCAAVPPRIRLPRRIQNIWRYSGPARVGARYSLLDQTCV